VAYGSTGSDETWYVIIIPRGRYMWFTKYVWFCKFTKIAYFTLSYKSCFSQKAAKKSIFGNLQNQIYFMKVYQVSSKSIDPYAT
jgi:hypothetical protein